MIEPWETIVNDIVEHDDTPVPVLRVVRSHVEFELEHFVGEDSSEFDNLKKIVDKVNLRLDDKVEPEDD